jgi:hypothetical protein
VQYKSTIVSVSLIRQNLGDGDSVSENSIRGRSGAKRRFAHTNASACDPGGRHEFAIFQRRLHQFQDSGAENDEPPADRIFGRDRESSFGGKLPLARQSLLPRHLIGFRLP